MDLTQLPSARVADLSVTLSEQLPGTWPGHIAFAHHNWNWFAEVDGPTGRTRSIGPYQTNFLVIDEHCGTHFDAPTHFVPPEGSGLPLAGPFGSETGDLVPPEELMGPAVVMDMRSLSEEGRNLGELPTGGPSSCSCRSRLRAPPAVQGGLSLCYRDRSSNEEDDGNGRKRRTGE